MRQETALITGASHGIGRELACLFAADKSNLVLVARSEDKLQELATKLRQEHGVEVHVLVQDLAQPDAAQIIVDQLARKNVTIDVLVNNAGFGQRGAFVEIPLQRHLDMIQVNITTLTYLTRLLLPGMLERGKGGILNVSSMAGFQPGPLMAVYYASKAYILFLTEALAEEVLGTGLKVSCLAPGPADTQFGREADMLSTRMFQSGVMDVKPVALAGYRGFRRGKVVVVPGWQQRLKTFTIRLIPRFIVRKAVHFFNQKLPSAE